MLPRALSRSDLQAFANPTRVFIGKSLLQALRYTASRQPMLSPTW